MLKKLKFIKYLANYSARLIFFPFMPMEKIFSDIYHRKIWNNMGSVSGDGSTSNVTEILRNELQAIIEKYEIKSILDIPCGDFNWMSKIDFTDIEYTGADIVEKLIENNRESYPGINFIKLDMCNDPLPKCDMIFCRDCLVHFSNKQIKSALQNIRGGGAKYLLMTTFPERKKNRDTITGAWRALNFQKPPYNFPEPLELINEGFKLRRGRYTDKSMGLWEVKNIEL